MNDQVHPSHCLRRLGVATRDCLLDSSGMAVWDDPILTGCVSAAYKEISLEVSIGIPNIPLCKDQRRECGLNLQVMLVASSIDLVIRLTGLSGRCYRPLVSKITALANYLHIIQIALWKGFEETTPMGKNIQCPPVAFVQCVL